MSKGWFKKGHKHSIETKKKMSEWHKGKNPHIWSIESRQKLSNSKKGKIAWNKGKKFSKEARKKMSETRKGNPKFMGINHPRYKGTTPLTQLIRHCFKYRQWRSDIFTRDDFTCLLCGLRGVYLEADHYPKKFTDIFNEYEIKNLEEALVCEEFWNINNGRTLCKKCHNETKKKQSLGNTHGHGKLGWRKSK